MIEEPKAKDEFYFQWHLTERCNRACRHCYQNRNPLPELPLSDLLVIFERMEEALAKWGKEGTISLTGGEPLIRQDDLHALMTHFDHSDLIAYYDILTNGSLISKEEASGLAKHEKLRRVQVSLEGSTARSNDAIRGPGSFDSTLTAIHRLREHGIPVSIMMTITKANMDEIPAVVN